MRFVRAARTSEVAPGEMRGVNVEGRAIVVCNVDGRYCAVQDECTHEHFPLSAGQLSGRRLACTLHGACFDVVTGEVLALPAVEDLRTYEVRVEGDEILVALD